MKDSDQRLARSEVNKHRLTNGPHQLPRLIEITCRQQQTRANCSTGCEPGSVLTIDTNPPQVPTRCATTRSRPDQPPSSSIPSLLRRPPRPLEPKSRGLVGAFAEPTRRRPKAELQAPDEPHVEPPPRRRVGALFAGEAEGERPPHACPGRRRSRTERPCLSPVQSHHERNQAAAKGGRARNARNRIPRGFNHLAQPA
jgi:hypothetical protein